VEQLPDWSTIISAAVTAAVAAALTYFFGPQRRRPK